jgi:hypothetical protein
MISSFPIISTDQTCQTKYFVTFAKKHSARTGNILFQYLFAKTVEYYTGNKYIPIEECDDSNNEFIIVNDENSKEYITSWQCGNSQPHNILCDGFFQQSDFYVPIRDILLESIEYSNDYWYFDNNKIYIKSFFECRHSIEDLSEKDIIISLRLDDFIQLPCSTSDIIPPIYYTDILKEIYKPYNRVFIVCDKIRHDWEYKYLRYFDEYNAILLQKDLMHDCALMRDSHMLIHSNSTLCWFMSFISKEKIIRYIPKTGFYKGQSLNMIDIFTDKLSRVKPLPHNDVYNLAPPTTEVFVFEEIDKTSLIGNKIFPLSYCIPDELIISDEKLEELFQRKTHVIAPLIPGNTSTYKYGPHQEKEYYEMYQHSRFAYTCKKGGWDCLRHYEIMANGCIPIFNDIENCPKYTLCTIPKELIMNAMNELLPYDDSKEELYNKYARVMLIHVRNYCSTSSCANYILNQMYHISFNFPKKVLLIMGNCGVNYTRETAWIGIKRYIQSIGGIALEYPKIDFLYESFPENRKGEIYGNGFTYSRKLKETHSDLENNDIIEMTKSMFWDLIIFGKVGPDELFEGSIPNMPLYDIIIQRYNKKQIVFLYGGDGCQNLKYTNRYSEHLWKHMNYGYCFIRELDV